MLSSRAIGSRISVTARLIALVMVPVTVMCGFAISEVVARRSTATGAVKISKGIDQLSALVEMHGALEAQKSSAAFLVRITELGISAKQATSIMGVDLNAETRLARIRASKALAELGRTSPLKAASLRSLYAVVDAGRLTPTAAVQRFEQVEVPIETALASRAAELDAGARQAHADSLVSALESLRIANGFVDIAAPQGNDLSALWFSSSSMTAQAVRGVVARLAAESAEYASAEQQIRALAVPTVVAGLDAIRADRRVGTYTRAIAAARQGEIPSSKAAASAAARVFQGYLARSTRLNALVLTATTAAREGARDLAASEQQAFILWAFVTTLVATVSLALAVGLAHSIARPLRGLAHYAHAVNEGDLDAEPPAGTAHGPRETRLAVAVFTDLVANLRLLDAKANALATCAFDDPVLSEVLPGRLGQSLESSVAVLSGSIVERDRLQTNLAHQATHDSLTGIANRAAAVVRIKDSAARAGRLGEAIAVLFVDLNDFKSVNDRHGHEVGDEVLRRVATRMTADVRDGDLVARLGGDEFVVVSERVSGVEAAMDLARRVLEAIEQPIVMGPVTVNVGAAIGVALTLDGPEDALRLLARADTAMYRAKHHDRSAIEIFDAHLQRQLLEREDVDRALAEAIADPLGGGLLLHYQPVIDTMSGATVGLEALIRWDRLGHGLLQPDAFVPVAETTGLIIDLDRWVLAEVSRQLLAWSDDPALAHLPVAVNISGRHLQSGQLKQHLAAMLAMTGIDPKRLTIEITETVLLDDLVASAAELDAVRALGVRVAIDDFGTGYTSLSHLQHLPIDIIKIDRSFVGQLGVHRTHTLVRTVTDLGHAIGAAIIAEGVETEAELSALRDMGADQVQGYLLSRPLAASALAEWVHHELAKAPGELVARS